MTVETAFRLLWPASAMLSGIAMILVPHWYRARARARHQQRLAARLARGSDAYFEELRSLKAYPPPVRALVWRGFGLAMIAMGTHETYRILTS
jgi:Flp pilus assembly protein TadB